MGHHIFEITADGGVIWRGTYDGATQEISLTNATIKHPSFYKPGQTFLVIPAAAGSASLSLSLNRGVFANPMGYQGLFRLFNKPVPQMVAAPVGL